MEAVNADMRRAVKLVERAGQEGSAPSTMAFDIRLLPGDRLPPTNGRAEEAVLEVKLFCRAKPHLSHLVHLGVRRRYPKSARQTIVSAIGLLRAEMEAAGAL